MLIFNKIIGITEYLSVQRNEKANISIGFVPTMGALHEGHLSLIKTSKAENNFTVCSIFINPLQFNDKNDYDNYPKNFDKDIELLKSTDCDVLFLPEANEMLGPLGEASTLRPIPDYPLAGLDKVMEGKFRPGHFKGVVYIVKRLFEIIQPDKAYFGLKDFQQYLIVKHISKFFNFNVKIIGCPIIRDYDGLALSSRNLRLSQQQRSIAPVIYKTLQEVKQKYNELSIEELKELVNNRITSSSHHHIITSSHQLRIDYFEIVDMETLRPIKVLSRKVRTKHLIACIAVYLGEIRLIDNIILFGISNKI